MDNLEILKKYIEEQTDLEVRNEKLEKESEKIEKVPVEEVKEEKKCAKSKKCTNEKEKSAKFEKEIKSSDKKEKLNERINILNSTNRFNVLPDIDISKDELDILKRIYKLGKETNYIELCKTADLKPSKLDKILEKLSNKTLINYSLNKIEVTELGGTFAQKEKDKNNRDKKFQKFIEILSDEEFSEFVEAVKSLKSCIK